MHRYLSSFMLALIVYALGGSVILWAFLIDNKEHKEMKIISIDKVCLTMIAQKSQPQIEQKTESIEQKREPTPKPKSESIVKKHEPKPKPVAKKPEPKPIKKQEEILQESTSQPIQEPYAQETIKEAVAKPEPIKKEAEIPPPPKPPVDQGLLRAKRERFISELINRINSNKSYPNSARRRAIEGEVEVTFTITPEGSVRDIEIISGHDIFKNSITEAIQNSFPIKIEDGIFEFPKKFKISILYILK